MHNPSLHPIAARWAAPGELFGSANKQHNKKGATMSIWKKLFGGSTTNQGSSRLLGLQEEANQFFVRFAGANAPKFDCRVEGGLTIVSTLSDLERKIRSDAQTLSSMGPHLDQVVKDLYALTRTHRSDRSYPPEIESKVKEIGELLGKAGGQHLMAAVGYRIVQKGCSEYSFSLAWDGVCGWMA